MSEFDLKLLSFLLQKFSIHRNRRKVEFYLKHSLENSFNGYLVRSGFRDVSSRRKSATINLLVPAH